MTWVAVGSAAIGAVGAIGGGLLGNKAAKKKAKIQKKALKYQIFADQQARNDIAPYRQSGYQALNAYNRAMGLGQVSTPQDQNLSVQQIYSGQYGSMGAPTAGVPITPEIQAQLRAAGYDIPDQYLTGNTYTQSGQPVQDDRYGGFYASPGYQFRMDQGLNALDKSAAARGRLRSGGQNKAITRYAQGIAADEFGAYTNRLAQIAGLGSGAASQSASQAIQSGQNVGNAMAGIGATRASGYANTANTIGNVANIFGDAFLRYKQQGNNVYNTGGRGGLDESLARGLG